MPTHTAFQQRPRTSFKERMCTHQPQNVIVVTTAKSKHAIIDNLKDQITRPDNAFVELHALGEENVQRLLGVVAGVVTCRLAEVSKLRTKQSYDGRNHGRHPYLLAVLRKVREGEEKLVEELPDEQ